MTKFTLKSRLKKNLQWTVERIAYFIKEMSMTIKKEWLVCSRYFNFFFLDSKPKELIKKEKPK